MKRSLEERAKSDVFLRAAMLHGRDQGWNEFQTLEYLVEFMLDMKDELFEDKLNAARLSTTPTGFILEDGYRLISS